MRATAVARAHPSASIADIWAFSRPRNLLPADSAQARYTLKARGAIYRFLLTLPRTPRTEVLLPAYHCPTIVYAIEQAGFIPRYYGVNDDLSIDAETLIDTLGARTAAVIVINFFGFPTPLGPVANALHQNGAALLEDCSHSFLYANPLRLTGERGDAAAYALWKLVPSGVGGLVRLNRTHGEIPAVRARLARRPWLRLLKRLGEEVVEGLADGVVKRSLLAFEHWRISARHRDVAPAPGDPTDAFADLAARYPLQREDFDCGLPWLQQHVLQRADLGAVAQTRRANYASFASRLEDIENAQPLFPALPADVVPWCFPLRIKGRKHYDYRMREGGVPLFTFGETLHPSLFQAGAATTRMLETAVGLRDDVLCIGIHQKLSGLALEQAAACVRDVLDQGPCARAQAGG